MYLQMASLKCFGAEHCIISSLKNNIKRKLLDTYIGCNLVLNVALEAIHLCAFLGISHYTVELSFWVRPHGTDFSHLSMKHSRFRKLLLLCHKISLSGENIGNHVKPCCNTPQYTVGRLYLTSITPGPLFTK